MVSAAAEASQAAVIAANRCSHVQKRGTGLHKHTPRSSDQGCKRCKRKGKGWVTHCVRLSVMPFCMLSDLKLASGSSGA
jgi:hypothetical protein